jgi:hypothetical protein
MSDALKSIRSGGSVTVEMTRNGEVYRGHGATHNTAVSDMWKSINRDEAEGSHEIAPMARGTRLFTGKCLKCGADRNKCCC